MAKKRSTPPARRAPKAGLEPAGPRLLSGSGAIDAAPGGGGGPRLSRVVLAEAEFRRSPAADLAFAEGEVATALEAVEIQGDLVGEGPGGEGIAIVTVHLAMAAAEEGGLALPAGAEDEPLVALGARFILYYICPGSWKPSEREMDDFAWGPGLRDAWPYWREFVQSSVARMGLPYLTIGPFEVDAPDRL